MTNTICAPTPSVIEERTVQTTYGEEKEILTKETCCVCENRIWASKRYTCNILKDSFSVIDSRAYILGKPNYLISGAKPLLRCHYDCKNILIKKLNENTFEKR